MPKKLRRPLWVSTYQSISGMLLCTGKTSGSRVCGISPSHTRASGAQMRAISERLWGIWLSGTICNTALHTTAEALPVGNGNASSSAVRTSNPAARSAAAPDSVPKVPTTLETSSSRDIFNNVPSPQPISIRRSSGRNSSSLQILRLMHTVRSRRFPRSARPCKSFLATGVFDDVSVTILSLWWRATLSMPRLSF